jgi:replicative DNA helicase
MMHQPPRNLDAEQTVLGAIIADSIGLEEVPLLRGTHFFDPVHGRLFDAIKTRQGACQPFDSVTLMTAFGDDEGLKQIGGAGYLATLLNCACDPVAIPDYAKIITDLAGRRAIMAACQSGIERAANVGLTDGQEAPRIAAEVETALQRIEDASAVGVGTFVGASARTFLDKLVAAQNGDVQPMSSFGMPDIDDVIGPLGTDDVIILGGRTSMGKSAVSMQLAMMLAEQGQGVSYFALEMNEAQMQARLQSAYARHKYGELAYMDIYAAYGGMRKLQPSAIEALQEAKIKIASLPIIMDYRGGISPSEVTAAVRKHKRNLEAQGVKLGAVFIDHIGEMKPDERAGSEYEKASSIARALKPMAKAFGAPIVACVQINREAEKTDKKKPSRSMLRDSGRIEEVADTILLVYRESYYLERDRPDEADTEKYEAWINRLAATKNKLEIIVDKARMGRPGLIDVWFNPATTEIKSKQPHLRAVK